MPQTPAFSVSPGFHARNTSGRPLPCLTGRHAGWPPSLGLFNSGRGSISSPMALNPDTMAATGAPLNASPISASLRAAADPERTKAIARSCRTAARIRCLASRGDSNPAIVASSREHLVRALDGPGLHPEMLLHFIAQVRHLRRIRFVPGDLVGREDIVRRGVAANIQHFVGIELLVRHG